MSSIAELARETSVFFVAGPPGCGKTTFLAAQVRRAVEEGKSVLLASLTKTAAHELAGRGLPIESRRIGTLHAHAFRALGGGTVAETRAAEWNAWCDEQGHPWSWHLSAAHKIDVDDPMDEGATATVEAGGVKTEGDLLLEEVGTWRARAVPRPYWLTKHETVRFAEAWEHWKAETGYLDFTDMIERCLRERVPPPVDFDVMFLDETQDSSRLEVMLALQWGALGETLVVAGDVRQNLYEWRGSEPGVFLEIDRVCREKRVLSQSYRVPRAVHARAVAWATQLSQDIDAEYRPRRGEDGAEVEGEVVDGPTLRRAEWIVDEAGEAASRGQTVMLLATTRRLTDVYVGALRESGLLFHNPYRPKAGHWNPIGNALSGAGAAAQLVAFSRVDDGVWGAGARFWTPAEIKAWTKPIRAEFFARGAKSRLADAAPMPLERFAEHVADRAVLGRMLTGDLDWYLSALTPGERKGGRFRYPATVAERHGVRALTELPRITVGTVHSVKGGEADCSPPDELVLTARGWAPISEIDPDWDYLVSFNADHHKIHRGGPRRPYGYKFTRAERPYSGPLLTITSAISQTRVTPNHHLTVRWSPAALERWAVYLMRRGPWWRIGMTRLHHKHRQSGVLMRMRAEGAEAAWILDTFSTQQEALYYETLWSRQFNVPDLVFEQVPRTPNQLGSVELHRIWDQIESETGARALLEARGRDARHPLWSYEDGRRIRQAGLRNRWQVRACNLLPGLMEIPCDSGKGQEPVWLPFSVRSAAYEGPVFSLDVERWHHYVSGGAVVHNCVYVAPDLSRPGFDTWNDRDTRDQVVRTFYVALTRAREKLVLLRPMSSMSVAL